MKFSALTIGLLATVGLPSVCLAQIFEDPFEDYVARTVTINPGAGNAKDANAAIHTINPWPPYAWNTRIPGDGRHAVNSMELMYRIPDPFITQQPGSGAFGGSVSSGVGASGSGGGGGGFDTGGGGAGVGIGVGAPMQPISSGN